MSDGEKNYTFLKYLMLRMNKFYMIKKTFFKNKHTI